jgi:hypothetical protein
MYTLSNHSQCEAESVAEKKLTVDVIQTHHFVTFLSQANPKSEVNVRNVQVSAEGWKEKHQEYVVTDVSTASFFIPYKGQQFSITYCIKKK